MHIIAVDASSTCSVDKWCPIASTLCPLSLPCKKAQAVSPRPVTLKAKLKRHTPENFVTIGGSFEHYMYCVTTLGCLKKERCMMVN